MNFVDCITFGYFTIDREFHAYSSIMDICNSDPTDNGLRKIYYIMDARVVNMHLTSRFQQYLAGHAVKDKHLIDQPRALMKAPAEDLHFLLHMSYCNAMHHTTFYQNRISFWRMAFVAFSLVLTTVLSVIAFYVKN